MSIVSRATLKGYFNDGDIPSVANHEDLIDSFHHFDDEKSVVMNVDVPIAADDYLLFVADRAVTLTSFQVFTNVSTDITYTLKRNRGGVITNISSSPLSGTVNHQLISTTADTTKAITTTSVASGDAIYTTIDGYSTGGYITFTLRYK